MSADCATTATVAVESELPWHYPAGIYACTSLPWSSTSHAARLAIYRQRISDG